MNQQNMKHTPFTNIKICSVFEVGGGLTTPLGLILSKIERNIFDFFSPQYFILPFRDNESYLPDSNVV